MQRAMVRKVALGWRVRAVRGEPASPLNVAPLRNPVHHICTTSVGRRGFSTVSNGQVQRPRDLRYCEIDQVTAGDGAALIMLRSEVQVLLAPPSLRSLIRAGFRLTADDPCEPVVTLVCRSVGHVRGGSVKGSQSIGFYVEDAELSVSVNGDWTFEFHRIWAAVTNSPAQWVNTPAHEIAHALLTRTRRMSGTQSWTRVHRLRRLQLTRTRWMRCTSTDRDKPLGDQIEDVLGATRGRRRDTTPLRARPPSCPPEAWPVFGLAVRRNYGTVSTKLPRKEGAAARVALALLRAGLVPRRVFDEVDLHRARPGGTGECFGALAAEDRE